MWWPGRGFDWPISRICVRIRGAVERGVSKVDNLLELDVGVSQKGF